MSTTPTYTVHSSRKPAHKTSESIKPGVATVMSRPFVKSRKGQPIPTAHVEKVFRVQKPKQVEAPPKSQTTAEKFSEQLDEYREKLYGNAVKNLQEAESQQVDTIQSLAHRFEQHLSILSESEAHLTTPIADEQVQSATSPSHDSLNGSSLAERVTLGQSLSDFSELVKSKEAALQQLFDDWNNIQTEIIAAAVQILGRESVEVEEVLLYDEVVEAMNDAAEEHVKMQAKIMVSMDEVESLETSARELTTNTELEINEAVRVFTNKLAHIRDTLETARRAEDEARHGFFKKKKGKLQK